MQMATTRGAATKSVKAGAGVRHGPSGAAGLQTSVWMVPAASGVPQRVLGDRQRQPERRRQPAPAAALLHGPPERRADGGGEGGVVEAAEQGAQIDALPQAHLAALHRGEQEIGGVLGHREADADQRAVDDPVEHAVELGHGAAAAGAPARAALASSSIAGAASRAVSERARSGSRSAASQVCAASLAAVASSAAAPAPHRNMTNSSTRGLAFEAVDADDQRAVAERRHDRGEEDRGPASRPAATPAARRARKRRPQPSSAAADSSPS